MFLQSFIFLNKKNIKFFLLILSFYITILQKLLNINYVVALNFLMVLLLFSQDISKLFTKKKIFFFYIPLIFFIYVIVIFFLFQEQVNYSTVYIISSYATSIAYFYIFYSIKIEDIENNVYKYLLYFNTFIVLFLFFSKFQSELTIIPFINIVNLHELSLSNYFHMILNIFSILLIIKNFNKVNLSIPLVILILFLFVSAEIKIIFFLLSFILILLLLNYNNKFTVINSFIIFFIFFSVMQFEYNPNKIYKYFSIYNFNNRVSSIIKDDFQYLNLYKQEEKKTESLEQIEQHINLNKSITTRFFSYKKFFHIINDSTILNFLFGHGIGFENQFYYHNFLLDSIIKVGFFGLIIFILPLILMIRNYFFIAKKNFVEFLQSYHCFVLFLLYIHLMSFPAWNTKFLFSFIAISYLSINKKSFKKV